LKRNVEFNATIDNINIEKSSIQGQGLGLEMSRAESNLAKFGST